MSIAREAQHWERLWYGGHADRGCVKRALQELGCDDRFILELLGPEPEEIEEQDESEQTRAA